MSNSVRPHRWQPTRLPCPWEQVWLKYNAGSDAHQRGGRRPKSRKKSFIFKLFLPWLKMWISVSSLLLSSWWTYVVVQSLSHVWLFVTQQTAASQAPTCPSVCLFVNVFSLATLCLSFSLGVSCIPTMFWVLHKELLLCSVYLATLIGGAGVLVEVRVCVCAALYWTNF